MFSQILKSLIDKTCHSVGSIRDRRDTYHFFKCLWDTTGSFKGFAGFIWTHTLIMERLCMFTDIFKHTQSVRQRYHSDASSNMFTMSSSLSNGMAAKHCCSAELYQLVWGQDRIHV